MTSTKPTRKPSLIELVTSLPDLARELIEREIALIKTELIAKFKAIGIGAGLIVAAVIVLLGMLGVLLTAAILALSLVMPGWLAALLVAAVLLIVAAVLGFVGYKVLMRGIPPVPTESITSLKKDLRTIKGTG